MTDDPLAPPGALPPAEAALPAEKKDTIPRDEPEIDTKRERLVTTWADRVKLAKSHWEPAFKRMKDDQEFAFGKQWSKDSKDPRYVANLALRLVAQKTAFLYAKNPKAVARRRERINATSWDETQSTLTQLMQSGAMMMQQGQQMAAAGQIPPEMAAAGGPMLQAAQGAMGSMMPMATGGPPGALGGGGLGDIMGGMV